MSGWFATDILRSLAGADEAFPVAAKGTMPAENQITSDENEREAW